MTYTTLDWDFENIWEISPEINNGYPYFRNQIVNGVDNTIPNIGHVLFQNYPNPFNPETIIKFSLDSESLVIINIYNIRGQKVKSLVNDTKTSGNHQVIWNGSDESGLSVSSGIYFYRMQANYFTTTKKMLLLK